MIKFLMAIGLAFSFGLLAEDEWDLAGIPHKTPSKIKIQVLDCNRKDADESKMFAGRMYCNENLRCNERVGDAMFVADERPACLRREDGKCPDPSDCLKDETLSEDELELFFREGEIRSLPDPQRPVIQ